MGKIRERLNNIFPMPARSSDQRIRALEDALQRIADTQAELAERLERLQDTAEETKAMQEEAQETAAESAPMLTECKDMLGATDRGVQEITGGDVFRRIEFTQGKLLRLEELLQKNMLSLQAQRDSGEYRFIARMRALFPLLEVRSDKRFVRIGRHNDGGYVMLDDFEGRSAAYSIGIADDVSWDRDIAARGLDVYMYDHTIEGLPEENERFHFSRTGIGTKTDADDPLLRTLPEMMADNGHLDAYGMILKIDVEGAEWAVLGELDEEILKHFSQIVFEFHGLTDMKNEGIIRTAMEKLNRTHQLVHLHANNFGTYRLLGGAVLPELLEGTYLLRDEYEFAGKPQDVSTEQDEINCPYLADICLGNWDV